MSSLWKRRSNNCKQPAANVFSKNGYPAMRGNRNLLGRRELSHSTDPKMRRFPQLDWRSQEQTRAARLGYK